MTFDEVAMHLQETDMSLDDVFARRIITCLQRLWQQASNTHVTALFTDQFNSFDSQTFAQGGEELHKEERIYIRSMKM